MNKIYNSVSSLVTDIKEGIISKGTLKLENNTYIIEEYKDDALFQELIQKPVDSRNFILRIKEYDKEYYTLAKTKLSSGFNKKYKPDSYVLIKVTRIKTPKKTVNNSYSANTFPGMLPIPTLPLNSSLNTCFGSVSSEKGE